MGSKDMIITFSSYLFVMVMCKTRLYGGLIDIAHKVAGLSIF